MGNRYFSQGPASLLGFLTPRFGPFFHAFSQRRHWLLWGARLCPATEPAGTGLSRPGRLQPLLTEGFPAAPCCQRLATHTQCTVDDESSLTRLIIFWHFGNIWEAPACSLIFWCRVLCRWTLPQCLTTDWEWVVRLWTPADLFRDSPGPEYLLLQDYSLPYLFLEIKLKMTK